MTLVHILYSGCGGQGRVFFSLVEGDSGGLAKQAVIFYGTEPLWGDYSRYCRNAGIAHHYVAKKRGLDLWSWVKILRLLFAEKPDKIVLHSATAVLPCIMYGLFSKCRVIVVEHTENWVKTRRDWASSGLAMFLSDAVVATTQSYARELHRGLGAIFRPSKVTIIPHGVNTEKFSPSSEPRDGLCITMVSRFFPGKDHKTLLDAFQRISADHRFGGRAELRLVGDGQGLDDARRLAADLGLSTRAVFMGFLGEDSLIQLLRRTDILVHSSLGENYCMAVAEALAVGIPVLASDCPGGMRELVREGETGYFFPIGDAEALAAKIAFLANDEVERRRLSRNARDYAVENFSISAMFQRYMAA